MTDQGPKTDWIDPEKGRPSCPDCQGYGYREDGTDEGRGCQTCDGDGVAPNQAAEAYLEETTCRDCAAPLANNSYVGHDLCYDCLAKREREEAQATG